MKRSKTMRSRLKIHLSRKSPISFQRAAWLFTLGMAIGTLLKVVGWA